LGVQLEKPEIRKGDIIVQWHGSPFPLVAVIGIIAAAVAFIVWRVSEWLIQREITDQTYYQLEVSERYEDVVHYLTEPPKWVCQECGYEMYYEPDKCPRCEALNIKREGGLGITDPEELEIFLDKFPDIQGEKEEGRWYEKYVKWALIGGGAILGTALIVPRLIEAARGS